MNKDIGGLGIRSTRAMNLAFLAKLVWRFISNPESLWVQTLAGKYAQGNNQIANLQTRQQASNVWRGMISVRHVVQEGSRRMVNSGTDTKLWTDVWLCDKPL